MYIALPAADGSAPAPVPTGAALSIDDLVDAAPKRVRRLSEYLSSGKTGLTPRARSEATGDADADPPTGGLVDGIGSAAAAADDEGVQGRRRRRSSATLEMIDFIKTLGVTVKAEHAWAASGGQNGAPPSRSASLSA